MHRVLVTDAEQRSSLAAVRSLGRAGFHVEVCSARTDPLAGASRYARATHHVPDPMLDPAGCLEALGRIVKDRSIGVLLPMTDISAALALGLVDGHPELRIPFPERDTWAEVADKGRLMEVAGEVGVPVPEQIVVEAPGDPLDEVKTWAAGSGYPVVLKPHRSAVLTESGVRSFGVQLAADADDLEEKLRGYRDEAYPVLVQERIEGPGLGAFFLSMNGGVIASFAHRRLREKPPTGGISVVRESVPLREDLERHSTALLERFRWSGVAMVEFKEDASTGTPYLMEINGRFWGSLQLAIDAGVDFPVLLLRHFLAEEGEPQLAPARYETGVRSRWFWGDVDHLLLMVRRGATFRSSNPELPGPLGAVLRFLSPARRQKFEVLRLSDVRPFLRESRQWIQGVLGRGER